MQLVSEIINTRKTRRYNFTTKKSMRDHKMIYMRIMENGVKMDLVSECLDRANGTKVTYLELLSFASALSLKFDLKLDRLAKRNKDALLCWYAENWDIIFPHISDIKKLDQNGHIISHINKTQPTNHDITSIQQSSLIDPSDLFQLLNYH